MKTVKITVVRRSVYDDLIKEYENPIEHACEMTVGDVFIVENSQKPEGFCSEAWKIIFPFLSELANGGGNFFDGWMKNPKSAMISCNDGFRPVSFLVETVE